MVERNVWAEIDLAAIKHNLMLAKAKLRPQTQLCAVVKADAYGHGAVKIAQTVLQAGADYLAVALTQEGEELRAAGISAPILILGALPKGHGETVVRCELEQAVFTEEAAQELSSAAVKLGKSAKVHLAVDTGMSRIGCTAQEAGKLARRITALPGIELVGLFSHFARADEADKSFVKKQYALFQEAERALENEQIRIPLRHICNSASIMETPELQLDMVRQGITLYGLWPSQELRTQGADELQPALTLKTRVVFLKTIPSGASVSYGGTFTAMAATKIATLPLGYADGLSRKLSNKGYVVIKGEKAPIVGRVCMDQIMVDVTRIADVAIGDEVVVFGGKEITLDVVADWMDTINYEVACLISKRVPRKYINEPAN